MDDGREGVLRGETNTLQPLIPQAVVHRGPAIPEIDGGHAMMASFLVRCAAGS